MTIRTAAVTRVTGLVTSHGRFGGGGHQREAWHRRGTGRTGKPVVCDGEGAVDTFYITDLIGDKIDGPARVKSLEERLLESATSQRKEAVAA